MAEGDRLKAEDERLRARLADVVTAILRISEDLDLEVVLQKVADSARSLTGASYVVITTMDDDGGLQDLLVSGMTPEEQAELLSYPRGRAVFGYLTGLREPLRTPDFVAHMDASGFPGLRPRVGAFMGSQIRVRDRHVGTIYIGDKGAGREFTHNDEETVEMFASQAAVAITNARRYGTELQAKAELETLIDNSPVGVLVFEARTHHVTAANSEANRIFGIAPELADDPTSLLRQLVYRRMDGSVVPRDGLGIGRSARTGESVRAEERVIERPDGTSVAVLVNATPIRSEDGEVTSVVATVQDLAALEELERLRAEFLGMVSHELRAPLALIKGSAASAQGASLALDPAEVRQFFRIIEEQADHMRDLINNLLDLSRIEAGTLSVAAEPADISVVIEQAKNAFASSGHEVAVETDLMGDLPRVMADRQRLVQVLYNLLSNASKHSRSWSTIRVSASRQDPHVAVSVTDEGIGIAPERLPRLFSKFSSTDSTVDGQRQHGYGLGLAICKGIVEAHRGRIWAESDGLGRGTRITFTVPAVDEATAGAAPSSGELPADLPQASPGLERILVVDDDPQMLRYVGRTLAEGGFAPVLTPDPAEVPGILEAEALQLVLLNLVLPGTDGFELMMQISVSVDLPVIFLSGRGEDRHIARAFDMGAADYIVKPVSPTELLTRVRAALRRRAQTRHVEPYRIGDLTVDHIGHQVTVAGRPAKLTPTEYKLLFELCANSGRTLTYDHLLQQVWGTGAAGEPQRVRTFIKDLRAKLGDDVKNPKYVFTVPGVGYRVGTSADG